MTHNTLPERIVIFDGVCNLCEFSVNFIYERDRNGKFTFTPAQSPLGQWLLEKHQLNTGTLDTVVLVKKNRAYSRSNAALKIAADLDPPWNTLRLFSLIPEPVRDAVYNHIAKNRYKWFGKKESCMIPTGDVKARFLEQLPQTTANSTF
ncbi:MAG: thiol-disulfide oxidoreductase DCC family protein [Chlorobiales bacterium]|nr:thiol-disulfide oxidoreductase DCC family protein [Chlorobiales bacterium]